MSLFTFGYEGLSIDAFIAQLKKAQVQTLLDIRQMPLSRKKGFSKTALKLSLNETGIEYIHLPVFGCPREIRDQYKIDGDWKRYEKAFNIYLNSQADDIRVLIQLTRKTNACLMCFEADFNLCHRSLVARATARAGGPSVIHLTAKTKIFDHSPRVAA